MELSRRALLGNSAVIATMAMLGLRPEQALSAENGVLKIATWNDINVLDPGYMALDIEGSVLFSTMPSLARLKLDDKGTWGWVPSECVEKIEQVDDLHIDFTLKQGLMWSDDAGELTAEDVKFTFERYPKTDWATRWETLDHVEVKDKYNGTIVLKKPFVAIWMMSIGFDSGFILPKSKVEAMPDQKFTTPLPAQLGPYLLAEWTPAEKIVLKANPNWHGTKPAFQEVHYIHVGDEKASELALQAKEVDAAYLRPETAAAFATSPYPDTDLLTIKGLWYQWMGMNTDHPKLKDVRVRKAIQRAVDVEAVIAASYSGTSPAGTGIVPPGILGHREKAGYSYNPDEARALLKEAGVSDLSLILRYDSSSGVDATSAQIIQANLADVGVKVELTPTDSGPYWELGQESKGDQWKDHQMIIMAFRTGPEPADAMQWFTKSQIGVWNWERWSDPEFEDLWQKALSEKDIEKRGAMYVRMQEIMENTGAYVWITFPAAFIGCHKGIKPGYFPGGGWLPAEFQTA